MPQQKKFQKMNALVWTGPRQFEMQSLPVPEVLPGEVLIKVAYAGICGSELSGYLGHNSLRIPPLVMGHEFSGEVVGVGAPHSPQINSGAGMDLRPGHRVTVNPLSCQGDSELQRRGLDQLCPTRQLLGAHRPGAFAEYVAVPAQSVTPLPASVTLQIGALAEPVACAVRIGELAGNIAGETCLVIGAGPIGLLTLQVLLGLGAENVFIADLDQDRLAMGAALGGAPIDPRQHDAVKTVLEATHKRGVPLAVDAVGTEVTREQCISATMPTGTVILSGLHEETSKMPAADIIRREIILRGSFAYSPSNFAAAVDMLRQDKIRLDPWIVEAPLADAGKWFERLIGGPGNVSKVLLVP